MQGAEVGSQQVPRRKYFATSAAELSGSGKSIFPKQIPNSKYWVTTNNDSKTKRQLVLDVTKVLDYGGGLVAALEFGMSIGVEDLPAGDD